MSNRKNKRFRKRNKPSDDMPKGMQEFLDEFKNRFDENKMISCDFEGCQTKLKPTEFHVFTEATGDNQVKVYCFEHLLAVLFQNDRNTFDKMVNENYPNPQRGALKMYFERKY